jgi:hypothetical protein
MALTVTGMCAHRYGRRKVCDKMSCVISNDLVKGMAFLETTHQIFTGSSRQYSRTGQVEQIKDQTAAIFV